MMSARRPTDIDIGFCVVGTSYRRNYGLAAPELNQSRSTLTDNVRDDGPINKQNLYRGTSQLGTLQQLTRNKSEYEGDRIESYSDSDTKMDTSPESEEDLDVHGLLERAQQSLEELRLNDAERQFLQTTFILQEKAEDDVSMLVEAYLGLADVCTRKSRAFRQSPLEWFWLCVHASTLLGEVVDLCQNELRSESDNQKTEWFNTQLKFAESRGQSLLDVLGRTLFNWMNEGWRLVDPNHFSNKMYAKTPLSPVSRFPLSSTIQQPGGLRPYQKGYMNHAFSIESLHEMPMKFAHVPINSVNWFKRIQRYCHRRLLSKNVKDIMAEIQNMREVQESPSDARIEIDTISEETDMDLAKEANMVDRSLKDVEEEEEEEEEVVTTIETYNIAEINEKARTDSNVKEYSLMYELASSDVDTSGWEFFLEERKEAVVQSVIEVIPDRMTMGGIVEGNCVIRNGEEVSDRPMSPVSSIDGKTLNGGISHNGVHRYTVETNGAKSPDPCHEEREKQKKKDKERFSPMREGSLRLTVAKAFQIVALKLTQSEEYAKAEDLYEDVLQILDEIQDGTVKLLKFNALLLQNTGLLCFRQGNRHNGLRNLEKALKIYKDLQDMEAHREVALVLIDLGNAYADDIHDEALYDKVIAAVCEFFEREASDEENGGSSPDKSSMVDTTDDTEQLKRISEAVTCYEEALAVLESQEASQRHIVAMATRKLGDCHFVKKEYPEALEWYEKALQIHRSSGFHGKDAVLENAHILSMLGVSTFMLHVYPRASHVFELALHMVKHAHGLTLYTFLHSLVLSLLGITYYKMKTYHKCVSMCSRAFETFWNLYAEKIPDLPQHKFWLVCQNLYILGNTYNILNLPNKGIKFLEIGRAFMRESPVGEKRQQMRILQILGDCYFAQYDYKTALVYYNEALDIGDKVSSSTESGDVFINMDENMTSSSASENLDMALHNQLLSRSADAHISMKQYQNAVHYLEQARDIQDVLEDDIKGDLVSTLHQLGQMHSMAGDVDKAIESYKESLDIFREIHDGQLAPEMCITLGNLATMCYVKACICEDITSELEMILAAEQYFQAALKEETNTSVCVKYANFLYSQANYEDAIMYLEDSLSARPSETDETDEQREDSTTMFFSRPWSSDIVYGGLERVTLPEPLQEEVDAQEEAIMPTSVLAYYILILSYKQTGQIRHAEKALIELMGEVYARDIPFLYAVLGYGLMELGLFPEAALEFQMAVELDNEYNLALDNYCLCMCVHAYNMLERGFSSIFVHCGIWNEDNKYNKKVAMLQGYY